MKFCQSCESRKERDLHVVQRRVKVDGQIVYEDQYLVCALCIKNGRYLLFKIYRTQRKIDEEYKKSLESG